MRSRYTAFALRDEDYLFRTWHPRTRPAPPLLGGGDAMDGSADPGGRGRGSFRRGGRRDVRGLMAGRIDR